MINEGSYKVTIIDDDPVSIEVLSQALALYPELQLVGTATCGVDGRGLIQQKRPNLLFLDVELPDMRGFKLLEDITDEVAWNMKVVFYTAYDRYMLDALHQSAFDYLLKPFTTEEIDAIVDRYCKAMTLKQEALPSFSATNSILRATQDTFMICTVTGFRLVHLADIGFFEYAKDRRQWQVVLVDHTRVGLKMRTTAEDIEGYSDSFMQISQSIIINLNYLAVVDGRLCQMCPPFDTFKELAISRGYFKNLQQRFYQI